MQWLMVYLYNHAAAIGKKTTATFNLLSHLLQLLKGVVITLAMSFQGSSKFTDSDPNLQQLMVIAATASGQTITTS